MNILMLICTSLYGDKENVVSKFEKQKIFV